MTRSHVLAAGVVLLAAGCGSTVAGRNSAVDQLGAGQRSNAGSDSLAAARPSAPNLGSIVGSTRTGDARRGTGGRQAAAYPSTSVPGATSLLGPGVTAKEIYVGLAYSDNGAAAAKAVGAPSAASTGGRQYYDATLADINSTGGIGGRRLVPRYFTFDAASSETFQQQEQQACSFWTEDHKVFAVTGGGDAQMRACTKKAGVLHVGGALSLASTETFATSPNYFETSGVNLDRVGAVTVDSLARTDYFSNRPKLGILTWDLAEYRHGIAHGWIPALRRHKLTVSNGDVYYITAPNNFDDVSAMSAALGSAAIKFRGDGVTHVLIADGPAGITSGAGITLFWLSTARGQHYYPRYGLNTTSSPQDGLDQDLYQPDDFDGPNGPAVAMGWDHIAPWSDQGVGKNVARDHCLANARRHGVDTSGQEGYVVAACDELYFLRAAILSGGTPTLSNVIRGIDRLGVSYASTSTYSTRFSPSQHDGAAQARLSRYIPDCSCFRFTSRLFSI